MKRNKKRIVKNTTAGCGVCSKQVSCQGTQPYVIKWTPIFESGLVPAGTQCTNPGTSGIVKYRMRPDLHFTQSGVYQGEGCGICSGCPEDYIKKKNELIAANPSYTIDVTWTWVATNRYCRVGCPNLCYKATHTKPSRPDTTGTLSWGCGPCTKRTSCTSCSGGGVSRTTLKVIKKTISLLS